MQDLRNYENNILDLASSENIDLTGKMALAQDEISMQVFHFLLQQAARASQGLHEVPGVESYRRRTGVSDLTVTPELKRWLALKTLELAYADAYGNQLNDRYATKLKHYESLVQDAKLTYLEAGVGIVIDPVARASPPNLEFISGVGTATTFYVQASWINQKGQESLPSELSSFSTSNGTQLVVTAMAAPKNVIRWNIYAGYTPDEPTLQNDAPVPIGTSWVAPPSGLRSGHKPGDGQTADRFIVNDRVLLRG
jgi:hypothetical protein